MRSVGFDRFDLAPEHRQRAAPELAEHVDVAPLGCTPPGRNSPRTTTLVGGQRGNGSSIRSTGAANRRATSVARNGPWVRAKRPTNCSSGCGTGSVNATEADGDRTPERIAIAGGVFGGHVPDVVADADLDHVARHEVVDPSTSTIALAPRASTSAIVRSPT
ncbi:MAG: hypothetical protein R2697_12760 [Ilumatobacteraceae bacterium]